MFCSRSHRIRDDCANWFPCGSFYPSALAKRFARVYQWLGMIESSEYPTIPRLAEGLRLDPSAVTKTINMVNLSPKIQKLIVEAGTPQAINREKIFSAIPVEWEAQARVMMRSAKVGIGQPVALVSALSQFLDHADG